MHLGGAMMRVAVVGVGKMGLHHLSLLGAHPDVELAAMCDSSRTVLSVLDTAYDEGIRTFMCTTHEQVGNITDMVRSNPGRYEGFLCYPGALHAQVRRCRHGPGNARGDAQVPRRGLDVQHRSPGGAASSWPRTSKPV